MLQVKVNIMDAVRGRGEAASRDVPLGGAADSDTPVGLFWERVPGGGPGSGGSG